MSIQRKRRLKKRQTLAGTNSIFLKFCREFDWIASAFKKKGFNICRKESNSLAPMGAKIYFMWAGSKYSHSNIINNIQRDGGVIYYAEHGWLSQRDYFYLDSQGTGVESSIARMDITGDLGECHYSYVQGQLEIYKRRLNRGNPEVSGELKNVVEQSQYPLFLVPMQKEADAQIVSHSPFKSMTEFLNCLSKIDDAGFLIKPHPRDHRKPDFLKKKFRHCPNLYFLPKDTHLAPLFDLVHGIVTINSCTGIEALAHGVPVTTFGEGIYTRKELVNKIGNKLVKTNLKLKDLACEKNHKHAIDNFLYKLFMRQLRKVDTEHPDFVDNILNNKFERIVI